MIIGTDEISSFVFFNYEWITWITHLDNYDGLNGPPAYVRSLCILFSIISIDFKKT